MPIIGNYRNSKFFMNIIEKYNQDKETTIQADISEFLHFNFSNYIMQQLKCRKDPNVKKLLSLFPLQPDTRKSEIKKIIDNLGNILSYDLLDTPVRDKK